MTIYLKCSKIYFEYTKSWLRLQSLTANRRIFSTSTKIINKKDVSPETILKAYKPKVVESHWYDWWESQGYFSPRPSTPNFTMLLPPPNVTGTLHLGHALTGTIQDVICRWRRMKGDSVLWIPGVDHAGIATQVVVEKLIESEMGKSKHDLGREKFIEKIWEWKNDKGSKIVEELRSLGLSLDWTNHIFTMDPLPSEAVVTAFIDLFEKGLIYRKDALVNWSCPLQSSISDVEVEWKKINGPTDLKLPGCNVPVEFGVLWKIAYIVHNSDMEIIVATTRPETMLGDTAIALHPEDPRRTILEGKSVWHPFRNCPIPIIFDSFVDKSLGTGAVKITPAHNSVDWEVAQRHNLPSIPIFDEAGKIITAKYKGKNRYEARSLVINYIKSIGNFRGDDKHSMEIPICSRSNDVVELMLRPQWFLNCKSAAQEAINAVKNGQLEFFPENYEKVWFNWLENIREWNISRQLWWGHRIPAYQVTCLTDNTKVWVAARSLEEAKIKGKNQLKASDEDLKVVADPDVLDTWFSSGLFPLYSLGWPNNKDQLSSRFPLPVMETGNDIIFYWVARMVMMSLMLTGEIPFKKVVLHGLMCDARGRKMSKSLGNVISPNQIIDGATLAELEKSVRDSQRRGLLTDEEVRTSLESQKKLFPGGILECGTDALRFTLCSQSIQSSSISFDVNTCHINKLFCNKVLQAFKFLSMSLENESYVADYCLEEQKEHMSSFDKWIISRLATAVSQVSSGLEAFQFHLVTQSLKQFIYSELCDVYLEAAKPILRSNNEQGRKATVSTLFNCLEFSLRLLHPFMPFLTEELYQRLPPIPNFSPSESIMISSFPILENWSAWKDPEIELIIDDIQGVISSVRKLNALFGVKGQKPEVIVTTSNRELLSFLNENVGITKTLARASLLTVRDNLSEDLADGFLKEKCNDNITVFAKFQSDSEVHMDRITPTLLREQKVRLQLDKLEQIVQGRISPEKRTRNLNKMKQLQLELEKILEIKQMLEQKR